jgi:hypothetical protein
LPVDPIQMAMACAAARRPTVPVNRMALTKN